MKIFCPCEKSFTVEHKSSINLDKKPELLKEIADGSFLTFKCPKCARPVRTELKTRIEWKSKNQVLLFVPEAKRIACLEACLNVNSKKRIKATREKSPLIFSIKKDETPVIGFSELVERVSIIQDFLDPHAIEVLKFFILDSGKEIKDKKIKIIYNSKTSDSLKFFVHGLKNDEMAVMNVPIKMYESILKDMAKKKNREVAEAVFFGNYLSYQNIFTKGQS